MLSGLSKSVKDTLDHHFDVSIFKYLNPYFWDSNLSWCNKWKDACPEEKGFTEKFWGSSRWFVFLTDAWHLFDTIQSTCWQLALAICIQKWGLLGITCNEYLYIIGLLLIIKILIGIPFELTYSHLFKKK